MKKSSLPSGKRAVRPKPHPVPPHTCGHPTFGKPLDGETERCIEFAVYGPRNPLNIDQLRQRIRALVAEALKGNGAA